MSPEEFRELLRLTEKGITRENTHLRELIPASVKLDATNRFLALGATFCDLPYQFRIHESTSGRFIPQVCDAIFNKVKET